MKKIMTWEEKYDEFLEASYKMLRYPAPYDSNNLSNFYARRFSDLTDMNLWYQEQYKSFREFEMLAYRAQLFINLVELKYQFPELRLCKKIEEATNLIIKNKLFPVPLTDKSKDNGNILTFSDGTDVGSFIANCKSDLDTNIFSPKAKALVIDLLNIKNYIVSKKIKQKLDIAIKDVRGDKLSSNKPSIDAFLRKCNLKYKNNELSFADRCYYEKYLFSKKIADMKKFLAKMRQLVQFSYEIYDFPNQKYYSDSKIGTFLDGSDMGIFVSKYKKKLENGKLDGYEKRMFSLYIDMVNNKKCEYDRYVFKNRLFETIDISIVIGTFPIAKSTSYIDPRVVFYSDGTNVGSYLNNVKQKIKNNKLDDYSTKLFDEYLEINFLQERNWNDNYNILVEYYNAHDNLDIDLVPHPIAAFLKDELDKIGTSRGLLQEYHEYKLGQIGFQPVNDLIDEKRKIKV